MKAQLVEIALIMMIVMPAELAGAFFQAVHASAPVWEGIAMGVAAGLISGCGLTLLDRRPK